MSRIIVISGPCGCGKSTFADRFARHLAAQYGNPVYLIHGDDFHHGFVEPDKEMDAQAFRPVRPLTNPAFQAKCRVLK